MSYNPAENAVLLTTDHDGGSYELFTIPRDANGSSVVSALLLTQGCLCDEMLQYMLCLLRGLQYASL